MLRANSVAKANHDVNKDVTKHWFTPGAPVSPVTAYKFTGMFVFVIRSVLLDPLFTTHVLFCFQAALFAALGFLIMVMSISSIINSWVNGNSS